MGKRLTEETIYQIRQLRDQGCPKSRVLEQLGISAPTLRRYWEDVQPEQVEQAPRGPALADDQLAAVRSAVLFAASVDDSHLDAVRAVLIVEDD